MRRIADAFHRRDNRRDDIARIIIDSANLRTPDPSSPNFSLVGINLDTSGSMLVGGGKEDMECGLERAIEEISSRPQLAAQTELGIFGFGQNNPAKCYLPYTPIGRVDAPPLPPELGYTFVFETYALSIKKTIERAELLRREYAKEPAGTFVLFLSDYHDLIDKNSDGFNEAMKVKKSAAKAGINFFALMCSDEPNERVAELLSQPGRPPIHCRSSDLSHIFGEWLPRSISLRSTSLSNEPVNLPPLLGNNLKAD